MSSVWVRLHIVREENSKVDPIKIKPVPEDVNDLKVQVKRDLPKIDYASLDEMHVYDTNVNLNDLGNATALDPGDPVPRNTSSKAPLIVTAPPPPPQQQIARNSMRAEPEEMTVAMSKASTNFATTLLEGRSIRKETLKPNLEKGTGTDLPPFNWAFEGVDGIIVNELASTPRAMDWLTEHFIKEKGDEKYGLKVMTGEKLPKIVGNGKSSTGKGDLCIGVAKDLRHAIGHDQSSGLIELKTKAESFSLPQVMLELASLSTVSRFEKGVALLATDCNKLWNLCYFSDAETITYQNFECCHKCWEEFRKLLDNAEEKGKRFAPKRKLDTIVEGDDGQDIGGKLLDDTEEKGTDIPPKRKQKVDSKEEKGTDIPPKRKQKVDSKDEADDEQDLKGFPDVGDDSKDRAIAGEAMLQAFVGQLDDLYGERPIIPHWATAEANCPDYYM